MYLLIKEGFCPSYFLTLTAHISAIYNRKYCDLDDKRESPGEHIALIDVEDILDWITDKGHVRINEVHPHRPEKNDGKNGVDHRQKSITEGAHRV